MNPILQHYADHGSDLEVLSDETCSFLLALADAFRITSLKDLSVDTGLPLGETTAIWEKLVRAGLASTSTEEPGAIEVAHKGKALLRRAGLEAKTHSRLKKMDAVDEHPERFSGKFDVDIPVRNPRGSGKHGQHKQPA